MGKALIVSGGTAGSYTIKPLHNRDRIDAEIASIESSAESLGAEITKVRKELEYHELNVEEWVMLVNTMIDEYADGRAYPVDEPGLLVAAHNEIRSQSGLGALTQDSRLMTSAQGHADWMNGRSTVGHTGAGGSSPESRIAAAGFVGGSGENVAAGQYTVDQVMQAWMNSPGHKANILRPEFNRIGYGYAFCPGGTYGHHWCINFGAE